MDVGFTYRESGKLPKVKVPGTFYYLAKKDNKGNDIDELWFCFSDTLTKRVDNELLNADEVNAVIKEYLEKNGGYATEKWVEDILKKYATKKELGGYTTKKELETKLGKYAKTDDLDGYATEKWVEDKDYATKTELGDYAKTEVLDSYVKKEDAAKKSVWEELTFID